MKTKTHSSKRQFIQKEKKLNNKAYSIFAVLVVFTGACFYFEPKTIGHDIRYNIFVFWLPTILGIIALGIYRRQFLVNRFYTNRGFILWSFMTVLYLAEGFVFAYMSVGQIARATWNIINVQEAKKNPRESLVCNVSGFKSRRAIYRVEFKFNGRYESINIERKSFETYNNQNVKYQIIIDGRKGFWNQYLVEGWTIENKN